MSDDNLTPDDAMSSNFERSEVQIAKDITKLLHRCNRLLDKHDKVLGEIHQVIIEIGRKLQAGRDMYGPGLEFGRWVERRRLNTSRVSINQQERTACMNIAKLHDTGPDYDVDEEDDGSRTPARLDLTDCRLTTPTDIMKWARKRQPHLFPNMRPRNATPPVGKPRRESDSPLGQIFNDPLPDACSFCGKDESAGVVLLKGENARSVICDACVAHYVDVLAEMKAKSFGRRGE